MLRRVVVNNAILAVQYAVNGLIPLFLIPHLIHAIGLLAYGKLAVAIAWAGYANVFVHYGFPLTGPKRIGQMQADETAARIFFQISRAKLFLLLAALPVLAIVVMQAGPPHSTEFAATLTIALFVPIGAALNSGWYLQATDRFYVICLIAIVGSSLALGIGFTAVPDGTRQSVLCAALALCIGPLFVGAATFVAARFSFRPYRRTAPVPSPIKALREGWPLFSSQAVVALYGLSGPIVVNYFHGAQSAGAYSAMERVGSGAIGLCLLTHTAAYPRLTALYSSNVREYWRLLRFVVGTYLVLTSAIVSVAWLNRSTVTQFLFASSAAEYDWLFFWGLIWVLLAIFGTALTSYLIVSARTQKVLPLTLKVLAVVLLVGLPGTKLFGASAWMAATALSQSVILFSAFQYWKEERGRTRQRSS